MTCALLDQLQELLQKLEQEANKFTQPAPVGIWIIIIVTASAFAFLAAGVTFYMYLFCVFGFGFFLLIGKIIKCIFDLDICTSEITAITWSAAYCGTGACIRFRKR